MKDPIRFLHDPPNSAIAALLSAARDTRPPDGSRDRVLRRLGLGTAALGAAATATNAMTEGTTLATTAGLLPHASQASAGAKTFAAATLTNVSQWSTGTILKVVGASLALGGGAVVGVLAAFSEPSTSAARPSAAGAIAAVQTATAPNPSAHAEVASAQIDDERQLGRPATSAVARRLAPSTQVSAGTLAGELALLDEARRAPPARALELLATFRARYPRAAMGYEASVLRINSLEQLGRSVEAVEVARGVLRSYPKGPATPRLRLLVGDTR